MIRKYIRNIVAKTALFVLVAASITGDGRAADGESRFFPAKDLMTIGVYYYPEHWPQEQWDRDFAKMEEMGFEFVHMAEFAWAFMEPEEGKFDFAWLDRAVELAQSALGILAPRLITRSVGA